MLKPNFVQPDPYTCTPTAFAYLWSRTNNTDFSKTLDPLIKECYSTLNNIKDQGVSFEQIQQIGKSMGIISTISSSKPTSSKYLTVVSRLPRHNFEDNDFITQALTADSLRIENDYFIYPYGHAIAVFEDGDQANVYDSLFGTEFVIQLSELEECLEHPTEYLFLDM